MEKITKHTLFVGLNDKDTKQQKFDTITSYKIVMNLVESCGYDGASISESTGFYKHDNGQTVIEKSLKIEILFADDDKTSALINQIKAILNQESVALQTQKITSQLV